MAALTALSKKPPKSAPNLSLKDQNVHWIVSLVHVDGHTHHRHAVVYRLQQAVVPRVGDEGQSLEMKD